jgi:hypothetical protein
MRLNLVRNSEEEDSVQNIDNVAKGANIMAHGQIEKGDLSFRKKKTKKTKAKKKTKGCGCK